MEVRDIQWSQWPSLYCFWEFQSMSGIWHSWFGRLIWPFRQFATCLRDTGLLQSLYFRLSKNQNLIVNRVDDVHEDVKKVLAKTQWSDMLPSSDTVVQQSSENPREVIPTRTKYITATGNQALTMLQSAASLVQVPLVKEAIEVALNIVDQCKVCKIPPSKGCKMVYSISLPEHIRRR